MFLAAIFCAGCTDTFWPDGPAPWETVDAIYYPDKSNLTDHVSRNGLKTLEECRDWVEGAAASVDDPMITKGDYECGIGKKGQFGSVSVYRLTLQ